ncbi:MAG: hypothetical protein ACI35S_07315 [Anaeroplasma sp.]
MTECEKCRADRIMCQYCIFKDGSPEIDTSNNNIIYFNNIKNDNTSKKVCPICKKIYIDYSSISRKDNKTLICTECGMKEIQEPLEEILMEYGIEVIRDN